MSSLSVNILQLNKTLLKEMLYKANSEVGGLGIFQWNVFPLEGDSLLKLKLFFATFTETVWQKFRQITFLRSRMEFLLKTRACAQQQSRQYASGTGIHCSCCSWSPIPTLLVWVLHLDMLHQDARGGAYSTGYWLLWISLSLPWVFFY